MTDMMLLLSPYCCHTCGQTEQTASLSAAVTTRQQLHPQSAACSERTALWLDFLSREVSQQTLEETESVITFLDFDFAVK